MRWTGHVALTDEMRSLYKIFDENVNGRNHLEEGNVDRKTTLE
jgi:hypothetical protein